MKRIVIFIDGTWNRPDAVEPTNVVRLARCTRHSDTAGMPQHVIYVPGVGAGIANTWLGRFSDRILGGALGWGLLDIIERAYRDLVFLYEPGDEIMIFGFSRGSFAARSLVGLIRNCGIPPRRHLHRIPEAIARYVSRDPRDHPNDPKSHEFRADFAPYTATSDSEFHWRMAKGDTDAIRLTIRFLGVWDTVSSLGVPVALPYSDRLNAQYRFHDTKLSSMVQSARHAIALDEHRSTYRSHPWSNLDALVQERIEGDAAVSPYQQLWFPGDHGSVGGGGTRQGLSSIALHWMTLGAVQAGLAVHWDEFDRVAHRFDVREHLRNKLGPVNLIDSLMRLRSYDRAARPKSIDDLSLAAFDRFRADPAYRPATLDGVYAALFDLPEAAVTEIRDRMRRRDGGWTHNLDTHFRPRNGG